MQDVEKTAIQGHLDATKKDLDEMLKQASEMARYITHTIGNVHKLSGFLAPHLYPWIEESKGIDTANPVLDRAVYGLLLSHQWREITEPLQPEEREEMARAAIRHAQRHGDDLGWNIRWWIGQSGDECSLCPHMLRDHTATHCVQCKKQKTFAQHEYEAK